MIINKWRKKRTFEPDTTHFRGMYGSLITCLSKTLKHDNIFWDVDITTLNITFWTPSWHGNVAIHQLHFPWFIGGVALDKWSSCETRNGHKKCTQYWLYFKTIRIIIGCKKIHIGKLLDLSAVGVYISLKILPVNVVALATRSWRHPSRCDPAAVSLIGGKPRGWAGEIISCAAGNQEQRCLTTFTG